MRLGEGNSIGGGDGRVGEYIIVETSEKAGGVLPHE